MSNIGDIDELSVKIEGAASLAWCLHETLANGVNVPESYNMAAYGLNILLDYLATDAGKIASQEAKAQQQAQLARDAEKKAADKLDVMRASVAPNLVGDIPPLADR